MNRFAALLLSGLLASTASVYASSITSATVYTNTPDPGNASDPADVSSTLPSANFTIGAAGINFQNSGNVSIATFLNNPSFTNAANGFSSATLVNGTGGKGTEVVITGVVAALAGNNTFVLGHDDGAVLTVAGQTIVNAPGGSLFHTDTQNYNNPGAAGYYDFTLTYSECCGSPADLLFQVNGATVGAVPEPSSLVLLGSGLLGACGMVRRRFAARS